MLSEKLYRALLVAYPREHRREYGELMIQLFRDRMRRDGGGLGSLNVWLAMIVDLVTSALKEHSSGGSKSARAWPGSGSTVPIIVWATILFFGFRTLHEFIVAPLILLDFSGDCCRAPMVLWTTSKVSNFVPFILLVASYPLVRRLHHDLLSHLWLYVIVAGGIGLTAVLPTLGYFHSMGKYVWLITTSEAVRLVAMVWFARKLSAVSFRHSLLFIGLATVLQSPGSFIPPQFHMPPAVAWPLPIYISLLIGGTLLRGLAVWSLIKVQTVTSSTRTALPPLVAMVLPAAALYALVVNVWPPFPMYYEWILPMLIVPALAIVATYAVRVRGPDEAQPGLGLQST